MIKIETKIKDYEFDAELIFKKIQDKSIFDQLKKEISDMIEHDLNSNEINTNYFVNKKYFRHEVYLNVATSSLTFAESFGHSILIRSIFSSDKTLYHDLNLSLINTDKIIADIIRLLKRKLNNKLIEDYYSYTLDNQSKVDYHFSSLFDKIEDKQLYFETLLSKRAMNKDNSKIIHDDQYKDMFNECLIKYLNHKSNIKSDPKFINNLISYLTEEQIKMCYQYVLDYLTSSYEQNYDDDFDKKMENFLSKDYETINKYYDIFFSLLKKELKKESLLLLKDNNIYNKSSVRLEALTEILNYLDSSFKSNDKLSAIQLININQYIRNNKLQNTNVAIIPNINNVINIDESSEELLKETSIYLQGVFINKMKVYQLYDIIESINVSLTNIQNNINDGLLIKNDHIQNIINYLEEIKNCFENFKEFNLLNNMKLTDLKEFDYIIQ